MIKPLDFISEIEKMFVKFAEDNDKVLALMQYGSKLSNTYDLLSDLDFFILTNDVEGLQRDLDTLDSYHTLDYKNKSVIYFKRNSEYSDLRKIDISYSSDFQEIKKYLKQSDDLDKVILVDKTNILSKITCLKIERNVDELLVYHINRFVESFENASTANQSADRLRFLFHQFIALSHMYTLDYMVDGNTEFNYLPKNFTHELSENMNEVLIPNFDPNSELRVGYITRKEIKEKFSHVLERIDMKYPNSIDSKKVIDLLDIILKRDQIWNLRDIADINQKKLKSNIILRASTLSKYGNEDFLIEFYAKGKIQSILDLRYQEEVDRFPYDDLPVKYYNVQIGSKHVKSINLKYSTIGVDPFFYEYFPRYYHEEIREIFQTILVAPKPILLHCHAGKDRTGIIVAMLQKLIGLDDEEIERDYLSSRSDTRPKKISVTLQLIEEFGGIEGYLLMIGMTDYKITQLKEMIVN